VATVREPVGQFGDRTAGSEAEEDALSERSRELLAYPAESRNRDNKGRIAWPAKGSAERLELVRDIMALANTPDGGVIVIGVENSTHKPMGLGRDQLETWDITSIHETLLQYAAPVPDVSVNRAEVDGKWLVAIEVREFAEVPVVCVREAGGKRGNDPRILTILRSGALYMRDAGARTVQVSSEVMTRALLDRAVRRKGDHLLRQIASLVPGGGRSASPDTDRLAYEEDRRRADEAFRDV
jgi:hypothetical protein